MEAEQGPDKDDPVPTTEADVPPPSALPSTVTDDQWSAMQRILNTVYDHRADDGHDPSKVFHRKVNKRALPSYYEVIKEPMALSTVKQKINNRQYRSFSEFVRDFALIPHNAQVYNRPEAYAYQDALVVKDLLEAELQKLVDSGLITSEVATLPDLGEIPPADELPPEEVHEQEEEEEEEEEEGEDDDDGEQSDDSRGPRRGRGRPRGSFKNRDSLAHKHDDSQKAADGDSRKKRNRPPRVDTPMESRIKNVLKAMRKSKDQHGNLKITQFDRIPDKAVMPEYYKEIKNPIAVDILKKKLKRKKYQTFEQFMRDVETMFDNAKLYNEDDSQIYHDAVELQEEMRRVAEEEQKKPDSDYVMEDGRLPLPNGILHNGELFKVGDWVHIQNANDLTKPIVTQIYRTWQDASGQKFVNACWYYRPEQTVHRFDKHFFEHEVVKTGQYRDHSIDEVVDRCFVMFVTRFNKGRPRNFPPDKDVYVCEARYNEEKHTLNKIKTWASCLPDEVRDKDYEMELFDEPKKMKKQPSPIAYLLRDDQKETDDLPKPEWGADNAPPKIGAVHRRPRDPKDSPPPEPTPSPPPEPPPPAPSARPLPKPVHQASGGFPNAPVNIASSQTPRQLQVAPSPAMHSNYQSQQSQRYQPAISPAPLVRQATDSRPPGFSAHTPHTSSYNPQIQPAEGTNFQVPPRYSLPGGAGPYGGAGANYAAPQPIEVWRLNDSANASIPHDIRHQFQTDDEGHLLFFTAPPIDTTVLAKDGEVLGHSAKYLAAKAKRDEKIREKRKREEEELPLVEERRAKRARLEQDELDGKVRAATQRALDGFGEQMVAATRTEFQRVHGSDWKMRMRDSLDRMARI